jgi:glycerophosphoryl diester phosphodiesterase
MASMPAVYAHRFGGQLGPESSPAALERSLAGPVDGHARDPEPDPVLATESG